MRSLLLAAILLAPTAVAVAVEGELRADERLRLEGDVRIATRDGALFLSDGAGKLRIAFGSAEGWMVHMRRPSIGAGPEHASFDPETTNRTLRLGPGALERFECARATDDPAAEDACRILLIAAGTGEVAVEGIATEQPLRFRAHERSYWAIYPDEGAPDAFRYVVPVDALDAPSHAFADARLTTAGEVVLFVQHAAFRLGGGDGAEDHRTGAWREDGASVPGIAGVGEVHYAFLVLALRDVEVQLPEGAPFALAARDATVGVLGRASTDAAYGWLRVGGERHELRGEPLAMRGAFALHPRAPAVVPLLDGPLQSWSPLRGDAERVTVGTALVAEEPPAAWVAASAVGAASLGALLAWRLFSRIRPDGVLEHPNRRRVLAALCAAPGLAVPELRERTGLARAVLQHHLGTLSRHGLVTERRLGRVRTFYPAEAAPEPETLVAIAALRDPTRLRVARALADAGALAPPELAEQLGLSRRLVTYHLARLRGAGLAARGPRGRAAATARLATLVAGPLPRELPQA